MTNLPVIPTLEQLATPLAWATPDGRIAGANPAFCRWQGVSVRRLLGQPLASLETQGEALAGQLAQPAGELRRGIAEALGPAATEAEAATLADLVSALFDRAALAANAGADAAAYEDALATLVGLLVRPRGEVPAPLSR